MTGALTRHDYRECPVCTANRPRFCAQYYEMENAVLIEQVKDAIADSLTPGGVKATYEQLLDMNAALRLTLTQQAQEVERLAETINNADYRHIMDPPDGGDPSLIEKAQYLVDRLNYANVKIAQLQARLTASEATSQVVEQERDELQGSVNRAGTYLGKDIAEKKQAEQQVARLRETLTKPLPR